jgi:hypothetical protein
LGFALEAIVYPFLRVENMTTTKAALYFKD